MEASLLTKSFSSFRFESLVKTKQSLRNRLLGIAKDPQKIYIYQLHRCHRLLDENLVPNSRKLICTMNSSLPSQIIIPSSYFVVLAPLVALCIGCVIGVFRHSLAKSSRPNRANAGLRSYQTMSTRWKAVIYENEVLNNSDANPLEKPCKPSEEQSQLLFETRHHDYGNVESEYSKFLSDCGVSSYGYWRGGTTE